MSEFVFKMPDIGEGIVEAEVVEWHVKPGDKVVRDAPLADVMTDKATVEMTSPVEGVIKSLGCKAGEKIVIGAEFVVFADANGGGEAQSNEDLGSPDSDSAAVKPPDVNSVDVPKAEQVEKPRLRIAPGTDPSSIVGHDIQPKPLASPAVRRKALSLGISLNDIKGSGEGGRERSKASLLASSQPSRSDGSKPREIPVIGLRRIIAERLVESKQSIPHFTYVEEIDVTELETTRRYLNDQRQDGQPKLSLLHFLMVGICRCVSDWPQCNSHYDQERGVLIEYDDVHMGVATMTDSGLMVPVVRHADKKSVWELADTVADLATRARSGSLERELLTGSTITVTSLGPLAGIATTPIINRPETSIIGPNKMTQKLELRDGAVVARQVMNVSSSFDHRIVDGHDAALLIQKLKGCLENPAALFV